MRVLVLTIGSRGDIQPFIALGQGLKAAGHDVFLCTATSFEAFVRENGLDYAPMTGEYLCRCQLVSSPLLAVVIVGLRVCPAPKSLVISIRCATVLYVRSVIHTLPDLQPACATDVLIKLTETDAGKVAFEGGGGSKLELMSKAKPAIRQMFDDAWQVSQEECARWIPLTFGVYQQLALHASVAVTSRTLYCLYSTRQRTRG